MMHRAFGNWLLLLSALAALCVAVFEYFWHGNGIHGTGGALIVIVSTALVLAGALVLGRLPERARGMRILLLVLLVVDILGTALAAYLLEAYALLALVVLALVGWAICIAAPGARRVASAGATVVAGLVVATLAALALQGAPRAQSAAQAPSTGSTDTPASAEGAQYAGWYTFNGDLMDQKYSDADQITPQNVGRLRKAWEVHTGDVSDGSGDIPLTDWSATPLFVNDTVYVSTPFYRVFAIEPDTGKVKWIYATHAAGKPCQKIVYVGTMDAKLHAVDADTGQACEGFGDHGVLDVDQWNKVNPKWPLSLLQPPTVYKDTLYIGWP